MDENIVQMITETKDLINVLMTKIDATDTRVREMETVIFNQILDPVKRAYEQAEYDDGLAQFSTKHQEKLGPYAEQLKAVEGDDFDFVKNTYDDYENSDKAISEDEYVDAVVEKVAAQLETIKEKLNANGVPAETVEATVTDTGVKIEAKDESGEVVATEEEIKEVVDNEEIIFGDEEPESDPDELADFEAELSAEMDKQK